jgi:hypothetical protein
VLRAARAFETVRPIRRPPQAFPDSRARH